MHPLVRRLGPLSAMAIGLSAMIGGGVFYVWSPAARAAGPWLLLALVIAAIVATLNALSTAQLAMAYPVAGGAYTFARSTLSEAWGFAAGVLFLLGKTASAAAIAVIVGGYLWPGHARLIAVAAVLVLVTVNVLGIRSTARVSFVVTGLVIAVLLCLLVAVAVAGSGCGAHALEAPDAASPLGVVQAAGLIFFSFAGYARIATLAEEVRVPRRTIPRAIIGALSITLVLYTAVAAACLLVLGPASLAKSASPVAALASDALGGDGWTILVAVTAAVAGCGSLLGVLAGLSRTALAMARDRELPTVLGRISARTHAPVIAECVIGALALLGALLLDPQVLVGFSATTVLGYYLIAHVAASRQRGADRWLPRWLPWLGAAGCAVLALTLPWPGVLAAVLALGAAFAARAVRRRSGRPQ
ncbi:amino acid permease [Rathayibacter sp. YIM 133350]|uniref:APC family permease n=1 Tax=Rathayibacter sp. YIM 133350 TaxID=3131992 RepID=UPI00307F49D4